jgi:hypothetical protein
VTIHAPPRGAYRPVSGVNGEPTQWASARYDALMSAPELAPRREPSLWDVVVEAQRFMVYGSEPPRPLNIAFP